VLRRAWYTAAQAHAHLARHARHHYVRTRLAIPLSPLGFAKAFRARYLPHHTPLLPAAAPPAAPAQPHPLPPARDLGRVGGWADSRTGRRTGGAAICPARLWRCGVCACTACHYAGRLPRTALCRHVAALPAWRRTQLSVSLVHLWRDTVYRLRRRRRYLVASRRGVVETVNMFILPYTYPAACAGHRPTAPATLLAYRQQRDALVGGEGGVYGRPAVPHCPDLSKRSLAALAAWDALPRTGE